MLFRSPGPVKFLSAAIIGAAIGPAIYFGFNKAVFGEFSGGYMQVAGGNGFFLGDLAEKFVSLWLDGEILYGEPKAGLAERFPWLLISLAGLMWVLIRGDYLLRVVAISICLLFAIYMPYGDLLPNGLWRYLNVHYFKWVFPFFGLFAWLLVKEVLSSWQRRKGWMLPALALIAVPILLLTLHLKLNVKPLNVAAGKASGINIELPTSEVDFIDLSGLKGGFTEIYFGNHQVLLDGREMKKVRDFRLLPMASRVRLLFIRPISGRNIEFMPDSRLVRDDAQMTAYGGEYFFALGWPKPFRGNTLPKMATAYRLGEVVDFSCQGSGQFYASEGWSHQEDWGRWSENEGGRIDLRIANYNGQQLTLEIEYGALVHPRQPCQRVEIAGDGGRVIAKQEFCLSSGGNLPKLYRYSLPAGMVLADGLLTMFIKTPDAISPKQLGMSEDSRILGVGLKTLRLFE